MSVVMCGSIAETVMDCIRAYTYLHIIISMGGHTGHCFNGTYT